MNMTKTMLALFGAAALATGAFAEGGPSIALNRVQQRYPWNGLVDIDYTVAGVDNPDDYYVQFSVITNGVKAFVASEFLSSVPLLNVTNGSYRVTWDSNADQKYFFARNATVTAELVLSPGDKFSSPYPQYFVIDISGGTNVAEYAVTTNILCTGEANALYNADEYKTNNIVLRRVRAPQVFVMGAPDYERAACDNPAWCGIETQHRVTLTEDFIISMFPITQAQWEKVMGSNPSKFQTDIDVVGAAEVYARPVDSVGYRQTAGRDYPHLSPKATSFIGVLRSKTKGVGVLDLPTESQWECAARAGTTETTYFGDKVWEDIELLNQYCWYSENSSNALTGVKCTHGVGQKLPNPWGLYDTIGNVWECCLDDMLNGASDDWGSDPQVNPLKNEQKRTANPNKGGSYNMTGKFQRAAVRKLNKGPTSTPESDRGFRLAGTLR